MWVGTQADFKRLLKLVEGRFEPLLAEHSVQATQHARKMLHMSEAQRARLLGDVSKANIPSGFQLERLAAIDSDIKEETQRLQEEEAKAASAGQIDLNLTGKDNERRSVTGVASELVEYLDGRHIQEVELSAPSGNIRNHSITLRAGRSEGLYLSISSTDSQWCIAGFSEISDEIAKQVPGWRFLRTLWFLSGVYFLASAVALWYIGDTIAVLSMPSGKFTSDAQSIVALLYPGMMVAITYLGIGWTRKTVPAFELVPPGGKSRGRTLFTAVGSPVVAVALGVLGNAISKVVVG